MNSGQRDRTRKPLLHAAYLNQLAELQTDIEKELAAIPAAKRFLVTNHEAFGYFAKAYNFQVVGTVIPASSTLAEPSASDLTDLVTVMQAHHICTIFTETTVSDQLAQVLSGELSFCDNVQVLPLYTGSLGPAGSGADSYVGFMRTNVAAIVAGLK
ncbi:MAG: metal ABC transporter substrate-binding protein [Anaerolineae bacterium]